MESSFELFQFDVSRKMLKNFYFYITDLERDPLYYKAGGVKFICPPNWFKTVRPQGYDFDNFPLSLRLLHVRKQNLTPFAGPQGHNYYHVESKKHVYKDTVS